VWLSGAEATRQKKIPTSKMKYPIFLLFLFTCCTPSPHPPSPAFYHWQQQLQLSPTESQTLQNLNVKKLYVKFFDIDLDQQKKSTPLATLHCEEMPDDSIQIIPTIFITNRTLKVLSTEGVKALSQNVMEKINSLWPTVSKNELKEIQFDCDWTETTRATYFAFIQSFREELRRQNQGDCQLSATIRLHQIKYAEQTGVPPVDRGMLMFYNVADLEKIETKNSILDLAVARQYLHQESQYALPLDIALPVFRWGVLFRDGKMIKLINNLDHSDLADTSRFRALDVYRFEVQRSTYLKAYYLYASDVIRLEWVTKEELIQAARFLNDIFYNNPAFVGAGSMTVSLYHLDTSTLKHYPDETLQQIFQTFSE
jgi:hypothetical protein